jgi:transposase
MLCLMDTATHSRSAYPSDVCDEEWAFALAYLTLMDPEAPQRRYPLRELFNGLRWMVRAGAPWRMMPHNLPPWHAVYEQTQRWFAAGCFEQMVHDLRVLIRLGEERAAQPSAVIIDSRTLQSTPESGGRAGDDGAKRRKGSKLPMVVDTLGELLAVRVTPANEQDRAQVGALLAQVQALTGEQVEMAFVDQGYTGERPAQAAAEVGVRLEVVKLPDVKRGFVLLPRRWVVERSFGWMARGRRLARDYERLPETLAGFHFIAFACLMLHRAAPLLLARTST